MFIIFRANNFEISHCRKPNKPARKQNLTRNSHSKSFKVTHSGIAEKKPSTVLHNNAGLISKVSEEITSEFSENCRCRQPHCRLTPPPQGIPANIRINLISPCRKQSLAYIYAADSMSLPSFIFSWRAPKDLFRNRVRIGRSRSSKVVDFGTKRRAYGSSY